MSEISLREKCGLLVYYPLAAGGLSGKYRDNQMPKNSRQSLFKGWERMINPLAMKAYDEYYKLAKKNNITMVQLAQAFVNSRPFVTSNIIGATTMEQLKENVESINLELSDVEISSQDIEGWLVTNQGNVTVALDVTITESLKQEGIAREIVNRIQNLRKDSGFDVIDNIDVYLLQHDSMCLAVQNNLDYIKAETLTKDLQLVKELESGIEISFDDIFTKLFIIQHK